MKKLSKKWKIFIISMAVLVGALYGIYKINNRNAFEEMYNYTIIYCLLGLLIICLKLNQYPLMIKN